MKQTTTAAAPAAEEPSGSSDTLLLVGGLALFALVLADTVFLMLTRRVLRPG